MLQETCQKISASARPEKWCAVDCETTGLSFTKDRILGIGFYTDSGVRRYITDLAEAKYFINQLINEGYKFTAHNQKFDWKFLRYSGVIPESFTFSFDTKIAIPLLIDKPGSSSLEPAAVHYLKVYPWKDAVNRRNMEFEDSEIVADYCLLDCKYTLQLTEVLITKLREEGQYDFYTNSLLPLDIILCRASYIGVRVLRVEILRQLEKYQLKSHYKCNSLREAYKEQVGPFEQVQLEQVLLKFKSAKGRDRVLKNPPKINWDSNKQLLSLLKDYCGIETRNTLNKPSVDDDALFLASQYPIVRDILEYRELQKPVQFYNQWLEAADQTDTIHTTFNVDGARTGRLSSSEPNMQQIPVRRDPVIRHCFVPRQGHLFVIRDLSQIEPRFIAHYSLDSKLCKVYRDVISLYGQVGYDIGLSTSEPNELKSVDKAKYNAAKTIVLGIFYNMGPRKLSFELKKATGQTYSVAECRGFIEGFFKAYPGVAKLRDAATRKAEDRGYLTNFFGRRVFVPKEKAYRVAMNTLIQSSASDFMCLLQLFQKKAVESLGAKLLLLVHDEEIYEVPEENAFALDQLLEQKAKEFAALKGLRVPIETEGGVFDKWGGEKISQLVFDLVEAA